MNEKLQSIKEEAIRQIKESDAPEKLNDVRVKYLGKKGELTAVLKSMKDVAKEDRPKVGQMVNEVRAEIETALEETKKQMEEKILEEKLKEPGRTQASEHDRSGRGGTYLHWHGIRGCGRTGSRVRLIQL